MTRARFLIGLVIALAATQAAQAETSPLAPADKGKVLYYRNPMGLPDTSPVPKKDGMGMDYLPVYADGTEPAGTVRVTPGKLQTLGVRTALVEEVPALAGSVQATGTIVLDERRQVVVTTRAEGWVETLAVAATGDSVRRGQVLAQLYAPDLLTAEKEYLLARSLATDGHADGSHGSPADLVAAALSRLKALDIPAEEVARLQRSGEAASRIPIRAPADGVVIDKPVVAGMRVAPGEPLYRLADLSTVWLVAEVPEREVGLVRPGQAAHATLTAYPGRRFDGMVDFIYPTLSRETRTARVRIILPNRDRALLADMYASVTIDTPRAGGGDGPPLVIPESAVLDGGARQTVLLDLGDGRFQPRAVHLGARGDGKVEVRDGVRKGDRVVVGANFLIDAESNLKAALEAFTTGPAVPSDRGTSNRGTSNGGAKP
ncbi:efflux RND transporter periplasmic adaptor subunit [Nitrospirillum viridazoti]|uniref:Efflux transporter periplasmic adaptor subunit n=1 Tax=Nitrospirillum viridazoti CBAmc TaxID=1441467 RepID=A0A248K0L1_9PROT|nr:efflux RND transporter periplasmic adaptor subunit [Nitrospirillum amazonense]ASG23948.1 efflux transporter periplasmic adaptor subunit [Nitrospirillum amazonense CBAmc]TWB44616.1 Cu(I)/Ag(I) efflux system membrane fusion protein [Nitrospirillum amazonense]